ncbi:MAG: hypothetical protein IIC02_02000 [Planctomycetes bacterium]|nr:hypothetical protein [Planctomycetota bacterium]
MYLIPWHILGLALAGAWLLVLALRGRYVGDDPRCRRCGYMLVGVCSGIQKEVSTARCSECGAELVEGCVVWGKRRLRWRLLVAICFLPLLAAPAQRFLWVIGSAERYRYYPVWMLLDVARSEEQAGIFELQRRLGAGSIGPENSRKIAELAVSQVSKGGSENIADWYSVVSLLDLTNCLTLDQYEKILPDISIEEIIVRSVIRQGEYFVADVHLSHPDKRNPPFSLWHEATSIWIAGERIPGADGSNWLMRAADWVIGSGKPPPAHHVVTEIGLLPSGRHEVAYAGRNIFQGSARSPALSKPSAVTAAPSWVATVRAQTHVTVLPANAPDPVTWIDDSDLTDLIHKSIHISPFDQSSEWRWVNVADIPNGSGFLDKRNWKSFSFGIESAVPAPENLALEVRVMVGSQELSEDAFEVRNLDYRKPELELVFRKGTRVLAAVGLTILTEEVDDLTIILSASRDVARRTVDLYEIWQGELRFGPFRVQRKE